LIVSFSSSFFNLKKEKILKKYLVIREEVLKMTEDQKFEDCVKLVGRSYAIMRSE
jgi:hypothetical protein